MGTRKQAAASSPGTLSLRPQWLNWSTAIGHALAVLRGSSGTVIYGKRDQCRTALRGAEREPYVKDGINDYIVHGAKDAVNPEQDGTKVAAHYQMKLGPGETAVVRLRLADADFAAAALSGLSIDLCAAARRS